MTGWLHPSSDSLSRSVEKFGAALALRGHPLESAWQADEATWATIIGYPRWSDLTLDALGRETGQAAALLEAYRRHGTGLLEHLFGHYVFAIVEPARNKAFCAVDRFGVYRLCHATPRRGEFVFATSADAVRAYPGVGATVSPQTVYQSLYFIDRIAAPGTIYDEQRKLRPGESLVYEDGEARTRRYWRLDYRNESKSTKSELHQALRDNLERAVARCLEGEQPDKTASFLSGGLDSSTITGLLAQANAGKSRCVTIAFEHADFDETPFAKIASQHFGIKHEIFTVGPNEVLATLEKLACIYDEPYSNSSAIPSFYCAQVSREGGDEVILAGDGGDELFGGNTRYLKDDIFDYYQKIPAFARRACLEPVLAHAPWRDKITLLRRANNYVALANRTVAERMTDHNAFAFTPANEIFADEAFASLDLTGPSIFANKLYDDAAGDSKIQRMMHLDLQLTLADSDLRKVLTTATAAGIRVRFPMLDDDLAAFSGTIPAGRLTEGGEIRRFYKDAMVNFLPKAILEKPKQGFGLPMYEYVAESPPLAAFFSDALSDLKQRHIFATDFLEGMIGEINRGNPGSHAGIAWDLAILQTWLASRNVS
jgi:asparagine synthase (glutamine-hydrolysing)